MSGTFQAGEVKKRPGIYFRVIKTGEGPTVGVTKGSVAALFSSNWGPLGLGSELTSENQVNLTYGGGGNSIVAVQALRGKAKKVLPHRVGTGGSKGTANLFDHNEGASIPVVKLEALYVGEKLIKYEIKESQTENKKELRIYDGDILKETIQFNKGTDGEGEPAALVTAVNQFGSQWIIAAKLADGSKELAVVAKTPFDLGQNPSVDTEAYTSAMAAIESKAGQGWQVLAVDSEDEEVQTAVQTYVDRLVGEGRRVRTVLGISSTETLTDRLQRGKAFNDYLIAYVINGVKLSDGTVLDGYGAAARLAGMLASADSSISLTGEPITGAVDIVGELTNSQIEDAISSGCLLFSYNAAGQIVIEYGINTYITPDADHDEGWKKLRRVAARFELMDRIAADWATKRVNNSPDGRATLLAAGQGIINKMIAEGKLLTGQIIVDPDNPPAGDYAYFAFKDLVDLDGAEKLYVTMAFQFGGQ